MGFLDEIGVNDFIEKAKKSANDLFSTNNNPQANFNSENQSGNYIFCYNCGARVNPYDKFCFNCGKAIFNPNSTKKEDSVKQTQESSTSDSCDFKTELDTPKEDFIHAEATNKATMTDMPPVVDKSEEQPRDIYEEPLQKEDDAETSNTQRRQEFAGKVYKCPACGEILNSFERNCPACGHEIRGAQGASSVRQLAAKLELIEARRPPKKSKNIFAQAFNFDTQLQSIDEQKIDLIKNFSIPNTKEDVLEFIVLASGNIDLKVYGLDSQKYAGARRELSDAWLAKLEQADQKAELLFGSTQEYLFMRNVYENKVKEIKKQKRKIVWLLVGIFGGLFLMYGVIFLLAALSG